MGTKARRIEHFPKMKVRGDKGRMRELIWSIGLLRNATIQFLEEFTDRRESRTG